MIRTWIDTALKDFYDVEHLLQSKLCILIIHTAYRDYTTRQYANKNPTEIIVVYFYIWINTTLFLKIVLLCKFWQLIYVFCVNIFLKFAKTTPILAKCNIYMQKLCLVSFLVWNNTWKHFQRTKQSVKWFRIKTKTLLKGRYPWYLPFWISLSPNLLTNHILKIN